MESVCDELMNLELRQVEKFDALVDHFENRLAEFKTVSLECQTSFFRQIEVRVGIVLYSIGLCSVYRGV